MADETYRAGCWGLDFENNGSFCYGGSQKSNSVFERGKRKS